MILDHRGQPIRQSELPQAQTEQEDLAHLRLHRAEHPSSGLTPARLAQVLADAESGDMIAQLELAEDLEEKDAHLYAELQKRKRALLGPDWQITSPRNASDAEKADASLLQELIDDQLDIEEIITDMADAILKGFSCLEISWQRLDGLWLPSAIEHREPAWFRTHPDHRNELRLRDNSYEGAALQPFGWICHTHKAKSGYIARSGLVRQLVWPFLFKNYSVRDLAEFLEIYGLPVRLGKYPNGASDKEKRTLLNAVMSIGHNAGGIIPQGMQIDLQHAAQGQSAPFEVMMSWAERSISKAILGGTLTSQADGKSSTNALGNVHNEVRQELRDADLKQIARTLSRDLVYPLYALNAKSFRHQSRVPRFEFDLTEPEDLSLYADALPKLVGIGMQIPAEWAHEKLQIPKPEKNQPVLMTAAAPTMPSAGPAADTVASVPTPNVAPTPAALTAEAAVTLPADSFIAGTVASGMAEEAALEQALDSLNNGQLQQQMQQMLQPLISLIHNRGPEAALDALAEHYPDMDDSALERQLAQVMFVADIWGQLHADV